MSCISSINEVLIDCFAVLEQSEISDAAVKASVINCSQLILILLEECFICCCLDCRLDCSYVSLKFYSFFLLAFLSQQNCTKQTLLCTLSELVMTQLSCLIKLYWNCLCTKPTRDSLLLFSVSFFIIACQLIRIVWANCRFLTNGNL